MVKRWSTGVTAFAVVRLETQWLMLRHHRLGVTKWEIPGGHVDPGETLELTAARECLEETSVSIDVGGLLASCVHEWNERRTRKIICFFDASPLDDASPHTRAEEPDIAEVGWRNPLNLGLESMSAFLHPLVAQQRCGWSDAPIHFRMSHALNSDGLWEPIPVRQSTL